MDDVVATSAGLYKRSEELIEKMLSGLEEQDLRARIASGLNPFLWMLGHLTYARCTLLDWIGTPTPFPWTETFKNGSPDAQDEGNYPATGEVLALWREVALALNNRLVEVSPSELSKSTPVPLPDGAATMRGAVAYLAYHESYHVGQMAFVHKALGKGRVSG